MGRCRCDRRRLGRRAARQGLLGTLMAAVRNEFRSEVLEFDADDPVFGGGRCRVAGCERHARGQGLCQGHRLRWVHAGRPDLDVFAATHRCAVASAAAEPTVPRRRLRLRGRAAGDLCAARPALGPRRAARTRQLAAQPSGRSRGPSRAIVPDPALRVVAAGGGSVLSLTANTWKVNGRPDIDEFAARFDRYPGAHRRTRSGSTCWARS